MTDHKAVNQWMLANGWEWIDSKVVNGQGHWRLNNHYVVSQDLATEMYRMADRRVEEARIDEIEDISQSRDVVVEDDGTIWCQHCHMTLEDSSQDCACDIIYKKRAERLRQLRATHHPKKP